MQNAHVKLADLLDLTGMQKIQDVFAQLAGMNVVLVDCQGTYLTQPSWVDGEAESGMLPPTDSPLVGSLCRQSRDLGQPHIHRLPTGLPIGVTPILLERDYMGCWLVAGKQQQEQLDTALHFLQCLGGMLLQLADAHRRSRQEKEQLLALSNKLQLSTQVLDTLVHSVDIGVYVTDFYTGEILMANNKVCNGAGACLEQLTGKKCWSVMRPGSTSFCAQCPRSQLLNKNGSIAAPYQGEHFIEERNIWIRSTHQAIYWVDGRLAHLVSYTDITELKQAQQQLTQLAFYDRAMQLPNDLKLRQDALDWPVSQRQVNLVGFNIVDIDKINEAYGREITDSLLGQVRDWVYQLRLKGAQLYRLAEEEFCIAIIGGDEAGCQRVANAIVRRFERAWIFLRGGQELQVFSNVVVSAIAVPENLRSGDDILNLIKRTMGFAAKQGRIGLYRQEADQPFHDHIITEFHLKRCVRQGMEGFSVHYQPIVDTQTGIWSGIEALCRWQCAELGNVSPLVFIAQAEQIGLIDAIGQWVCETAIRQCKVWGLDERDGFLLHVNISPSQLFDRNLVHKVLDILDRFAYPADHLSLEITESIQFEFNTYIQDVFTQLHSANIHISLDDFGTGYSSFGTLRHLPMEILKTEKSFIDEIVQSEYLQLLYEHMVQLAHAVGMKMVAEGVETPQQVEILLEKKVDFMQGYLFSKPLCSGEMEKNLERFYHIDPHFITQ